MYGSANHRRGTTLAKRFGLMTFAVLALAVPAPGQDRPSPGPITQGDQKAGALGCTYTIFLEAQALATACGWTRQPADDAIDKAIATLDDFILANASSHLTRPMLEDLKRSVAAPLRGKSTGPQYCEERNYELIWQIRSTSTDQIREWVKVLTSTPPPPGPYGCF